MREVVHHVALALAVLALADAALRVASRVAPSGLERAIVALVLAVATALPPSPTRPRPSASVTAVALAAGTAVVWVATLLALPAPAVRPSSELAEWWRGLGTPWQVAAGALGGLCVAWVVWQLRYPSIGFDSAIYHYPEVAGWIDNGRPGSILPLSYDIPYGNYPLTDEVAQTWGAAIARSWVPLALWNPAMLATLAAACWLTLRNVLVSPAVAGLATAVLVTNPLLVHQLNEPQNDLPAMTWLACTAALALGAGRRPALLAPALVAAGLAIGTKTTTAPMALAALAVGAYLARGRLRPVMGWLALALGGAFVVGGVWYARNLVDHGAPLWPFSEAPWGDPRPRLLALLDTSFLERPVATLDGRLGEYTARLGGGWLLLLAAPLVVIFGALGTRLERPLRRSLIVAGGLTLVGMLIWSTTGSTGLQRAEELLPGASGWPITAIRYLLPVVGVAVLGVAIATRAPRPAGLAATALLAVALAWSVVADARLGAPYTPPIGTLLVGAGVGVLAIGALTAATRRQRPAGGPGPAPAGALAVLAAVGVGCLLTPAGNGFIERHVQVSKSTSPAPGVIAWFLDQPGFAEGEGTIGFASRAVLGPLAGDHFTHRLELIPRKAPCGEVRRLADRMPVLFIDPTWFDGILGVLPYSTGRCLEPRSPAYEDGAYFVYAPRPASISATTTARAE